MASELTASASQRPVAGGPVTCGVLVLSSEKARDQSFFKLLLFLIKCLCVSMRMWERGNGRRNGRIEAL